MKQSMKAMLLSLFTLFGGTAWAQNVFIQIEAHPDLATAQERARIFSEYLPNVKGFQIGSRWFAIALGPFDRESATSGLDALKELSMIPADSYLAERSEYSWQYFPAGSNELSTPQAGAESQDSNATTAPEVQPPSPPDETRRQALQGESLLSGKQKQDLQHALRDFGFYQGSLDAVFGKGTRRAMAAWQISKGYDPTEVLTTRQRSELIAEHQELLSPLGLRTHLDEIAGIELTLPGAMVAFDRYEPPFAHYSAVTDQDVSVTLISQAGDAVTLQALYEVMQTLTAAAPDSEPQRGSRQFTISSVGERGRIFVYATLVAEAVKGFILTWPDPNDALYGILVEAMLESFTPIPEIVMPDAFAGGTLATSIDLIGDLDLHRPKSSHSGFYIDSRATVLTADESVNGCGRVMLDGIHNATPVAIDESTGLALLKPTDPLVPPGYARMKSRVSQPRSRIAVSGYSFGGKLNAPTLTFGRLADLQGLHGEETLTRLELVANPGDAGGPVIDTTGSVLGLLLPPQTESSRHLPPDVSFAANIETITKFVESNGHRLEISEQSKSVSPVAITRLATDMTVLVSCWPE